ncbi:MAG: dihydrolipoamide acetyltransferase family protein [Gammaproteobacteria bacterium]
MSEYIFKLPDLGEGTVEAEIGDWSVKVGDMVAEEAVVGTMMTDKAAVEVSAPVSGRVTKLAGEPGDMIAVGAALVVFATDGQMPVEDAPAEEAPTEPAPAVQAPVPAQAAPIAPPAPQVGPAPRADGKVITSPAIRRRAKQMGIDLTRVGGSGPNGRILPHDFESFVQRSATSSAAPAYTPAETTEVKVIGLRRMIANRMSESKREIPHFSYVEEMDVTQLDGLRVHLNERANGGVRLTPLPFIALALMRALREFPQCNATYDKERNVIIRHGAVHLGIATQTPDGLKVPVVRNADQLTLEQMAEQIKRVAGGARDNTIGRDELTGSTITLTSLGKLGGIASTPVINMPEVGIIGVNRVVERPMVVNGQIAVRQMMNLSSSFDHRFVDGFDAAAMIQRMREMLEQPATLFMPT